MNWKVLFTFMILLMMSSCGEDTDLLFSLVPAQAVLVFPENNSECTEGTVLSDTESEVIFRWGATENTSSYEVVLTNLFTGTIEILDAEENKLPIIILRATPYSWNVNSKSDINSPVTTSDTWSFYNAGPGAISYIPFPAKNLSPIEGTSIPPNETTVNLLWEAIDLDNDILEFDVYFGTSTSPVLVAEKVSDSFLNDLTIISGTTYYWKILTRDLTGNESISQVFSFNVQ